MSIAAPGARPQRAPAQAKGKGRRGAAGLQHQPNRAGIGIDLHGRLASGDDRGHGRIPKAPGQRPGRRINTLGNFLAPDALGFGQFALHIGWIERRAHILAFKTVSGTIDAGQHAAGQRHPREHAQSLRAGGRETAEET